MKRKVLRKNITKKPPSGEDFFIKIILTLIFLLLIARNLFTPDEIRFTLGEIFGHQENVTAKRLARIEITAYQDLEQIQDQNLAFQIQNSDNDTEITEIPDVVEEIIELDQEEELIEDLEKLILVKNFTEIDDQAENLDQNITHNDRVIILFSLHKQETSLISDLFNLHHKVFYLHEPLSLIHHGCESVHSSIAAQIGDKNEFIPAAEKHALEWLDSFSKCQFEDSILPISQKLQNREHHLPGNFPFRYKTAKLCKSSFCEGQDFSLDSKNCWKKCPPVNLKRAEITCTESKVKVVQTIRVCKVGELHRLVHPGRNLRVVLVTRDPRAVAYSKITNHQIEIPELITDIKRICFEKYENILSMLKATATFESHHEWLMNDAYIIRYEDIILNPKEHAERLLNFADLEILNRHEDHFEAFLDEAHHERIDDWREKSLLKLNDVGELNQFDHFNPMQKLEWDDIKIIQESCESLMVFMGYRIFKTREEYENLNLASLENDYLYSKEVSIVDRKRTVIARNNQNMATLIPGVIIKGHGGSFKNRGEFSQENEMKHLENWNMLSKLVDENQENSETSHHSLNSRPEDKNEFKDWV